MPESLPPSGRAFDLNAPAYDRESAHTRIAGWIHGRVQERLARLFRPGDHVLELGCGTGEDALWLARRGIRVTATDISPAMLAQTQHKAEAAHLAARIETGLLDLNQARAWNLPAGAFDGAFSNYGALNCIPAWRDLSLALARAVRPGGKLGFAVMGRFCLWETAWHGLHGDLRTAARRWRGSASARIEGVAFPVYYPTPRQFARAFAPHFRLTRLLGLGVCLPPSDVYGALAKRPRLAQCLLRLERLTAPIPILRAWGDHFWAEFTCTPRPIWKPRFR